MHGHEERLPGFSSERSAATPRLSHEQLLELRSEVQHGVVSKLAGHVRESEEYLTYQAHRDQKKLLLIILGATVLMAAVVIVLSLVTGLQLRAAVERTAKEESEEAAKAMERFRQEATAQISSSLQSAAEAQAKSQKEEWTLVRDRLAIAEATLQSALDRALSKSLEDTLESFSKELRSQLAAVRLEAPRPEFRSLRQELETLRQKLKDTAGRLETRRVPSNPAVAPESISTEALQAVIRAFDHALEPQGEEAASKD